MLSTWNAGQRCKQPWYGESMCKCVVGNGKRQGRGKHVGGSQYCPQAAPCLSTYFFLCLSRMAPLCISTPDTLERMCRTRSKMSRDVMAGCMRVVCVRVSECVNGDLLLPLAKLAITPVKSQSDAARQCGSWHHFLG